MEWQRQSDQRSCFLSEADDYQLKYRCEDCVHVKPSELTCSLGFPNAQLICPPDQLPEDITEHLFCKYFEL